MVIEKEFLKQELNFIKYSSLDELNLENFNKFFNYEKTNVTRFHTKTFFIICDLIDGIKAGNINDMKLTISFTPNELKIYNQISQFLQEHSNYEIKNC